VRRVNGDGELAALRTEGRTLPVLLSTGIATWRDVERVLGAGVAGVQSRPNTGAQLRDAIAAICHDSAWSMEGVLPFGT
jgi:hypothetical protein